MSQNDDPLKGLTAQPNPRTVPRYGNNPRAFGEYSPYVGPWEESPTGRMERLRRELQPTYNLDDLPPDLAMGALEMLEESGRDHMLWALGDYYRNK